MKLNFFALLVSLLFTFLSCKKSADYGFTSMEAPPASSAPTSRSIETSGGQEGVLMDSDGSQKTEESTPDQKKQYADNAPKQDKGTKIIKDGYLELEVKGIENVKRSIDTILKKYNAYYENDQYTNSEYQSNYSLKIRIKASSFDQMINNVMDIDGVVKNKNINARDVTDDYYDTESRLNSSKKYLNRYYDLLSKAKSIKDIMDIEEKIQKIQIEIDSYEGRLKYMDDQVSYSTLNLTLTENHEFYNQSTKQHFGKKILNAFKAGGDILANIILVLITLWPLILIVVLVWMFRKRIFDRFRK